MGIYASKEREVKSKIWARYVIRTDYSDGTFGLSPRPDVSIGLKAMGAGFIFTGLYAAGELMQHFPQVKEYLPHLVNSAMERLPGNLEKLVASSILSFGLSGVYLNKNKADITLVATPFWKRNRL